MDISQLFIIGIPADGDLSAVKEFQPGGVILMGRNAAPMNEIRRLTRAIREASSTPPFLCIDHEGGRVQRLVDGFSKIPPDKMKYYMSSILEFTKMQGDGNDE